MTIRIEGAKELIKRIDNIQSMRKVKASIREATIFIKGKIADEPRVRRFKNWRLYGNSDAAKKMRAGFFYHLNRGDIEIPYQRGSSPKSEKLKQSWTTTTENDGWIGIVGTDVSYAELVQSSEKQYSAHRQTGWVTTRQVEQLHGQTAIDYIRNALLQEVQDGK
jgi:hypothetical protein